MDYQLPTNDEVHLGTFIKTTSPHVIEVLGGCGLAFGVLDAEHAPWDQSSLDIAMIAGRAADMPLLVRIARTDSASVLQALDLGASGLLVPHVDTPEQAAEVVANARYIGGTRGYSGSHRHGGYGALPMEEVIRRGDAVPILCQIESELAVRNAAAIASVAGVGALFIGRGDLSLSMGILNPRDPAVDEATQHVIRAGLEAKKVVGMFVADDAERRRYQEMGVSWFVQGSDQALMRRGAIALAQSL